MTAKNGLSLGLVLLLASAALAQGPELAPPPETVTPPADAPVSTALKQAAENAKANFRPLTKDDVEAARSALAQRSKALENRVGPTSSHGAAWLEFLKWNGVQKQLAPNSEVDLPAARTALKQLMSGAPGLEVPEAQAAAAALEKYIDIASFQAAKDQGAVYNKLIDDLLANLEQNPAQSARTLHEVERRLDYLTSLGQAPQLIAELNTQWGQTNFFADASANLLNRLMARPVSEVGPVTDCILGTSISGTGCTNGQITVTPLDSSGVARIRFNFTGNTQTSTVGRNGPVAIRSSGNTSFAAAKVAELSDEYFRIYPADVNATTRSKTKSVTKVGGGLGAGLIERIARKKVAESKNQADAIASDHAEDRIAAEFNEQLLERLTDARRRYDDRLRRKLRARFATPQDLVYSSNASGVQIQGRIARRGQVGANSTPPAPVGAADLVTRMHQTAANNFATRYLGGAKFSQAAVDADIQMTPAPPEGLAERLKYDPNDPPSDKRRADFKPWSVELRESRPVSFTFRDNEIEIITHANKITSGDESFLNWDLVTKLVPERSDNGWTLVRQGDIELFPADFDPDSGKRLNNRQLALRSNLNKAINNAQEEMGKVIEIDRIEISNPESSLNALRTHDLAVGAGWLVGGWNAE
jgi:hypothetical protein